MAKPVTPAEAMTDASSDAREAAERARRTRETQESEWAAASSAE